MTDVLAAIADALEVCRREERATGDADIAQLLATLRRVHADASAIAHRKEARLAAEKT